MWLMAPASSTSTPKRAVPRGFALPARGFYGPQSLFGEGSEQPVAAELEEVAAGWKQVTDLLVHRKALLIGKEKLGAVDEGPLEFSAPLLRSARSAFSAT